MDKHVKVDGCSSCPFASWTPRESNCELLAPDMTMLPRERGSRLLNCPMLAGPVVVTYTTPEHDGKTDSTLEIARRIADVEKALGNVFKDGAVFGEGLVRDMFGLTKKDENDAANDSG